jgi:site-specific DNA recombinase
LEQQRKITTIPASISRFTAAPIDTPSKRKVAAYARVSTDHDEQFTSYEAQIDYYTKFIKARDDWEFVKVYTDEGITGTSTKHREGFKSMVADALAGKIDLIVTKSVSRFARNTVDSLTTIRKLKEHGTECFFEKENIWTFDSKGELLITIMSVIQRIKRCSIQHINRC